ncbi:hypothetical protein K1719_033255 [Acacia pycnantha]|nr:hypothetical protein K1719_033255 [Acacia pycnantha]
MAFVGAMKGYKVVAVMPASVSDERKILVRAFGADVYITDPAKGLTGALEKTEELLTKIPNSSMLRQCDNPSNPRNRLKVRFCVEDSQEISSFCKHLIEGIGPEFMPNVLEFDDEVLQVSSEEAIETAKLLALKEGLLIAGDGITVHIIQL